MRDANLKMVRTMLEKGAAGQIEELRQYIDPDFVVVEADGLPYPGTFHGFEGYVHVMKVLFETWQDLSWDVTQLIADDENVVVRLVLRGRLGDRKFEMPVCEVWEIRGGKLVRATPYYFDTKLLADIHEAHQREAART